MERNAFHFYTFHDKILTFIERVKQEISKLPTFYLRRCMLESFFANLIVSIHLFQKFYICKLGKLFCSKSHRFPRKSSL